MVALFPFLVLIHLLVKVKFRDRKKLGKDLVTREEVRKRVGERELCCGRSIWVGKKGNENKFTRGYVVSRMTKNCLDYIVIKEM